MFMRVFPEEQEVWHPGRAKRNTRLSEESWALGARLGALVLRLDGLWDADLSPFGGTCRSVIEADWLRSIVCQVVKCLFSIAYVALCADVSWKTHRLHANHDNTVW
jgi:hypothetical protein